MRTAFPLLAFALLLLPSTAFLLAEEPAGDASPEVVALGEADDTGRYSHLLSYELAYRPPTAQKEAEFVATLANVSDRTLKLMVDRQSFDSEIEITPSGGRPYAVMTERGRNGHLFGNTVPHLSSEELAPGKSITWRLPLSSLRYLCLEIPDDISMVNSLEDFNARIDANFDRSPSPESLAGCKAHTTIYVAVVPEMENGPFSSVNGRKTSNVVKIPPLKKK
ncbi:hypothetical protein [Blastopirellula retiformator]|uniref:Uncharacterized protein n=1 Tax=Blastopirellula retiformator TaxID=2527970 RepID=A0A5C5VB71_9BACT|nr:hypothetical protein [Blastopirellula retiformator]TWT34942.1 hypothetical protein Enr8_23580 [Blastopirellula retiformator]